MNIRDDEIKRLIFYAKALGVKITIRDYNSPNAGEWAHDPISVISINKKLHNNKTQLILTILHELAHAKFFILNKKPVPEAFILEAERASRADPQVPKSDRKKMMEYEVNGLELMPDIARDIGLKIKMNKILLTKELDQWTYIYYYEYGNFPTALERKAKKKELKNKLERTYNGTK